MDKNFTYVIDDEEKNITVYPMGMNDVSDRNYFKNDIIDGAMDAAADIKDAGRQIDGKDVVCLEYLDAVKTVVYFDKKTGQPLLMETLEIGGNKAIRFSNFKFGGIDDAIFELPEGYKKVDIFN